MEIGYNVKLKSKKIYEQNDHLYLKLVYQYETDSGVYELIIPKIALDICTTRIPTLSQENSLINPGYNAWFGSHEYDLEKASTKYTGVSVAYVINTIEEKKHEMTLEEIEKKLGYKVKIVSEKEKQYENHITEWEN